VVHPRCKRTRLTIDAVQLQDRPTLDESGAFTGVGRQDNHVIDALYAMENKARPAFTADRTVHEKSTIRAKAPGWMA
jgi:hypothetical protein